MPGVGISRTGETVVEDHPDAVDTGRRPITIHRVESQTDPDRLTGIGVIAPFDFALDGELWSWLPDDISLYVTRTPRMVTPVSLAMAEHLRDEIAVGRATDDLLAAHPSVVAYACTSASYVDGLAGERRLRRLVEESGAPVGLTTSGAMLEALAALDASRVAVATPYDETLTKRLIAFLEEAGHEVVSAACLNLTEAIAWVADDAVSGLVRRAHTPEADAVVVSCTNLPTYRLVASLEHELGCPVVSANLATVWAGLNRLGRTADGRPERLLRTRSAG